MPLAFSHLVGHYDTQYCMYMWSEMYSMDMFHMHFKQEGILIGKVRMDYRSWNLRPWQLPRCQCHAKALPGLRTQARCLLSESRGCPWGRRGGAGSELLDCWHTWTFTHRGFMAPPFLMRSLPDTPSVAGWAEKVLSPAIWRTHASWRLPFYCTKLPPSWEVFLVKIVLLNAAIKKREREEKWTYLLSLECWIWIILQ